MEGGGSSAAGGRRMKGETLIRLFSSFPGSFMNESGEFIAHGPTNQYFNLEKCKSETELRCKVLEWLSRAAYKAEPYKTKRKNVEKMNKM